MLTKMKLALTFALCAAVGGGVALANGKGNGAGRPNRAEKMKQFDTNKDGKLDDAERAPMKAARQAKRAAMKAQKLARFDANRNGQLDPSERDTMKSERQLEHFKKLDANSDGKITIDEFKAAKHGKQGMHRRGHGGRGGQP